MFLRSGQHSFLKAQIHYSGNQAYSLQFKIKYRFNLGVAVWFLFFLSASEYDIRISNNPLILRQRFFRAAVINASSIKPKNAGSRETFTFRLEDMTVHQGIITYIAILSIDKAGHRSEVSNLVHVTRPMVQEEDTSHAYSATVRKNSTTTVILSTALGLLLCIAIGAGVYAWLKCSSYELINQTSDNGSLISRKTEETRNSTKFLNEEICLQVMSTDDVDQLVECIPVLEEVKIK